MRFSIIVPVYNAAAYLRDCIAALQAQDYPRDDFEILLVDNNSTDGSAAILRASEGIRALTETRQGSYAARNCGLRAARGDSIAFTDSDCAPDRGWLRAIEKEFERPATQIVLGCRRPAREDGFLRLVADYENTKDHYMCSSEDPEMYYGYTNNMAVRRTTMEAYGPFLERPRGSDTAFVRHVVEGEGRGAVAYARDMRIVHYEMRNIRTYYKKMFVYARSRRRNGDIIVTRPLSGKERLHLFRETVRRGGYSLVSSASLGLLLAGGLVAWGMGFHSRIRSGAQPS